MENKPSAISSFDSSISQEKRIEIDSAPEKFDDSLGGKKKMKYLCKVSKFRWDCDVKTMQALRKRRYDFASLSFHNVKQPDVVSRIVKFQKSIVKLEVPSEKFLRRKSALRCLRNLTIDHMEKSMNHLAVTRNNNKVLQNLRLAFLSGEASTDSFLCRLIQQIRKNPHLLDLSLDLSRGFLSDTGVMNLSEQLGKNCRSLQSLCLRFNSNENITDNGVKSLAEHIGNNLKSLQHLELGFSFVFEITDDGVKALAESIGNNLRSLEYLFLKFDGNGNITDDGVEFLAEQLGNILESLQDLYLDFDSTNVTGNAGESLVQDLGTSLRSLGYLSDCYNFTSEPSVSCSRSPIQLFRAY